MTEDGAPLAGVLVRASPVRQGGSGVRRRGQGLPQEPDVTERVLRTIRAAQDAESTRREAHSGAEGAFAIGGLDDAAYRVQAYLEGYEIEPVRGGRRTWDVRPGAEMEFVAREIIDVPVAVLMPDGTAPERATIACRQGAEGSSHSRDETWVPDDPIVQLSPGTYTLSATAGADQEYRSEEHGLTVKSGESPAALAFHLRGRSGIKGKVIFAEGESPQSAHVWALRVDGGEEVPGFERFQRHGKRAWASPHNEFLYTIMDIEPGRYAVAVSRTDGRIDALLSVDVAGMTVEQDIAVPPVDPAECAIIWVLGPDGRVLPDVSLTTGWRSGGGSSSGGATVVKREADGAVWVLHHSRSRDFGGSAARESAGRQEGADVRYFVGAQSKRFGSKEVEYRRRPRTEVTIRFTEPATLDVTIANWALHAHRDAVTLSLEKSQDGEARRFGVVHHDGEAVVDGRRHFGPIEPGDYELVLGVKSDRFMAMPLDVVPVALAAGSNAVTVSVPELATLTVTVDNPSSNMHLQLQATGASRARTRRAHERVGEDGLAVFGPIPPGDYTLHMWGPGSTGVMRVRVDGDTQVRFDPSPMNALEVRIHNAQGLLARQGLADGDMIIGVDGEEFTDGFALQAAMMRGMSAETITLMVLRGSRRVEVAVEPKKMMMMEDGDMGGDIEPSTR